MNPLIPLLVELEHICQAARESAGLQKESAELMERSYISLERINGRLDRLELWMAREAGYPNTQTAIPDLTALRAASGIEESMAFTKATLGTASSSAYNEIAGYFNGEASYPANPISLITFNDETNYAVSMKNLDTTNGRVLVLYKADGTILLQVDKNGLKGSINGSANAVALAASASPVLTGSIALDGRIFLKKSSTNTASANSITLPNDGSTVFPITGNTQINTITGVARMLAILEFQSAGCVVRSDADLRLNTDFTSSGSSSLLTLLCSSGGKWQELARGGHNFT